MLVPILIGLGLIVVVFLVIVVMQPSGFRIIRSATMAATPSEIFAQVNDFHLWEVWSPWAKIDPNMKQSYEGAASGVGAIHTWSGNNKAGEGRLTITETRPHDLIRLKLEFLRPFRATNEVEFTFEPERTQTLVTWSMTGTNNFIGKVFGLIMNMDKMVGGDFEKGLASLSSIVEKANS